MPAALRALTKSYINKSRSWQPMTKRMELAVAALQEAIDEEMERKAKLGYKAVIADENGNPVVVAAKTLVRKRRRLEKTASNN